MIRIIYFVSVLISVMCCSLSSFAVKPVKFFAASNASIQYTGRIDFSNPLLPRFWNPGVYIQIRFKGDYCDFIINDEMLYGTSHNYIEVVLDGVMHRIKTKQRKDTINVNQYLGSGEHFLIICKNTESLIGYLEFAGIRCRQLLPPPAKPSRKIEFIGNSITCGAGSDLSEMACDKGQWYDRHNAWLSYGPSTARALNAQWHLSSVSGIGLIHSCCDMKYTMPDVFDNLNLRVNGPAWDFKNYRADVVTIGLGTNDGFRDSTEFCSAYVKFIKHLRVRYPEAELICLNSPMGDSAFTAMIKKYISSVVEAVNNSGDLKVHNYYFLQRYHNGCGDHPDLHEHSLIAAELASYIKKLKKW